jgi:hypothetical protein
MLAGMRKALRVAVALVGALALTGGALHLFARARATRSLVEYSRVAIEKRTRRRAELDAIRLPALGGAPVDAVCLPIYERVGREHSLLRPHDRDPAGLAPARAPAAMLAADVHDYVVERRSGLDAMVAAMTCSRVDVAAALGERETPTWFDRPGLLLVLDGHARVQDGDPAGAIGRYVAAIRYGVDIARTTTDGAAGERVIGAGALGLARHLAASAPTAPVLDSVEADLARLEPLLPSASEWLLDLRLVIADVGHSSEMDERTNVDAPMFDSCVRAHALTARIGSWLRPARAQTADAVLAMDAAFDEAARAADTHDAARLNAEVDALVARGRASSGARECHVIFDVAAFAANLRLFDSARAAFALLRAVALVERARVDGVYPTSPSLGIDPCTGSALLRYARSDDGKSYRISSVGEDGHDDRGEADDLLVEGGPP